MTTLYLIRHGETPWNVEGRYQGQLDPPLTDKGQQQAQATAAALVDIDFEAIYSSDLARAKLTADALAGKINTPIHLDERLREIHQGEWQNVVIHDIRTGWPEALHGWENDPWQHYPPGGETLQQLQERVFEVIDEIAQKHSNSNVAIFTHKLPIALLKIRYQGHPRGEIWSLLPKNAAWEIFEVE